MSDIGSIPIQKRITTNATNTDVFAIEAIASELLTKYNFTTDTFKNQIIHAKVTILPDTSCTVIINDYEQDAPDFYSTGEYTGIRNLSIKESGISALVIIQIR